MRPYSDEGCDRMNNHHETQVVEDTKSTSSIQFKFDNLIIKKVVYENGKASAILEVIKDHADTIQQLIAVTRCRRMKTIFEVAGIQTPLPEDADEKGPVSTDKAAA